MKSRRPATSARGFTLIEMMVVVAIVGIMTALAAFSFSRLKARLTEKNFSTDLTSMLLSARMRSIAKQRNVVVVFITDNGANSGYYMLDDMSSAPGSAPTLTPLTTPTALAAVATAFTPNVSGFGLGASYLAFLIDSALVGATTGYAHGATPWGAGVAFPFPFSGIPVSVAQGCTFCSSNRGAVGFLPDGRAVFSSVGGNAAPGSAIGGAVVIAAVVPGEGKSNRRASFISVTGHVEDLSP